MPHDHISLPCVGGSRDGDRLWINERATFVTAPERRMACVSWLADAVIAEVTPTEVYLRKTFAKDKINVDFLIIDSLTADEALAAVRSAWNRELGWIPGMAIKGTPDAA
jgi:hypothetical protein